jgi:hypothetical protein
MDMPDTDRLGDFAKKKVAESDARVNKSRSMTPTKKDPIVTMDAVKKAGFTNLRDYLNDKRGLKRRDGKAPERTKEYMAKNMIAPAVEADPMGDAARDKAVMNDEDRKRKSAPRGAGPSDAEITRAKAMTAKATSVKQQLEKDAAAKTMRDESNARAKATSVKQQLEKDAAAKTPKARYGEAVVGMKHGGSVRGDGCAVKGKTKGTMR